jgi:phage replication-related protein YjqB (UPF0714/DUF867 family)
MIKILLYYKGGYNMTTMNPKKPMGGNQQNINNYQQKANQYQQEASVELAKANQNLQKATTKAQQKTNQFSQEAAVDFLDTNKSITSPGRLTNGVNESKSYTPKTHP